MTEQDLEQASEIYRKRRRVQSSLDGVMAIETLGLERANLDLAFLKANEQFPSKFARIDLDAHSAREICTLARKLLEERLRDIDASLRAFGCEPPKPAPTPAAVPVRQSRAARRTEKGKT
jgi:hypothetical protein